MLWLKLSHLTQFNFNFFGLQTCLRSALMYPAQYLENHYLGRDKRIWYLSPMRAAKVQASLRIRAVSPEPLLLAHTSSESRGIFRQKARYLAPLNGWACAVKICNDGSSKTQIRLTGLICKPTFHDFQH